MHVYTFRYEANQVFLKMKSTVPLESCLDYYIAYPYVFVFVNHERVNIHRMDMLQSKFLLRPPKSLAEENKIFYFQKRLFFLESTRQKIFPSVVMSPVKYENVIAFKRSGIPPSVVFSNFLF